MDRPATVIAHGVDLVDVQRVGAMVRDHADRFVDRVFTQGEQEYANASQRRRDEHLAARFAAKEAVIKALGTGWTRGIAWTDVEVVRAPSGEPSVRLAGRASQIARERGIDSWLISISHTGSHAMASVLGLGGSSGGNPGGVSS